MRLARALILVSLAGFAPAVAKEAEPLQNASQPQVVLDMAGVNGAGQDALADEGQMSPYIVRLQVLLDRAGVSPGVIDGIDGENVAKAVSAFDAIHGANNDGRIDEAEWAQLSGDYPQPVLIEYEITDADVSGPFMTIPEDYAEKAKMEAQGYETPLEMFGERFHMDEDLIVALNPDADFGVAGTRIVVADPGLAVKDIEIARIEVDKAKGSLWAFDAEGRPLIAYPASVGSAGNESPHGTHKVEGVALDPVYYYDPEKNFQQGDNTEKLEVAAGPNNPVGRVWIDLDAPTYGIHGTPYPALIDKVGSHGCVRLANWDAIELAELVKPGVAVEFVN